jgi:hypothetical protein
MIEGQKERLADLKRLDHLLLKIKMMKVHLKVLIWVVKKIKIKYKIQIKLDKFHINLRVNLKNKNLKNKVR